MIYTLGLLPALMLVFGFPIYLILFMSIILTLVFVSGVPLTALHQNIFGTLDSYALLAVPFFIYAGELMGRGTVALRLVEVVQSGIGSVRGSMALTTIGASTIFGAMSGSSAAGVATVGRIMHNQMRGAGYPENFSAGLVTSTGALGMIIPPSIPMIVYGVAASQSVPRLYAAGIVPGLLVASLLAVYVIWKSRAFKTQEAEPFSLSNFLRSTRRALWALGAPVIILGGIYGGVFSPTEAAAAACVYAALVTIFVFRELGWRDIVQSAANSAWFTAQILIVTAGAGAFAWLLTINQIPAAIAEWIDALQLPVWALLLIINLILLIVGCLIDGIAAILLLSPILMPVIIAAGVDPIHFGIIMVFNLAIGSFTPPFGINIFVSQSALGIKLRTIYIGIVPCVLIFIIGLLLTTYIPEISLSGMWMFFGK